MGQLIMQNMEFYARHGHYKEEQLIGGRFLVDLVIETDFSEAAKTDDLQNAIDYTEIYNAVKKQMAVPSKLLEHLAEKIIYAVYEVSEKITKVTIKVSKMNPAIGGKMERFCVVLTK